VDGDKSEVAAGRRDQGRAEHVAGEVIVVRELRARTPRR
jgi:hypothetical protein